MNDRQHAAPKRHDDEVNSLALMLNEIDRMNIPAWARAQFIGLLHRMAGHTVRINRCQLQRPQHLRLAQRLLDEEGTTVAEVRAAMVQRTGISSRSAYRLIGEALNQRFEDRRAGLLPGGDAQGGGA